MALPRWFKAKTEHPVARCVAGMAVARHGPASIGTGTQLILIQMYTGGAPCCQFLPVPRLGTPLGSIRIRCKGHRRVNGVKSQSKTLLICHLRPAGIRSGAALLGFDIVLMHRGSRCLKNTGVAMQIIIRQIGIRSHAVISYLIKGRRHFQHHAVARQVPQPPIGSQTQHIQAHLAGAIHGISKPKTAQPGRHAVRPAHSLP